MVIVVSTWQVPDFERWKRAFDVGMAKSERSGLLAYRVCRALDEADEILLEFEFDTRDNAIAWLSHADEAWLAHAGLDVYPPMFMGEPIEDFRAP